MLGAYGAVVRVLAAGVVTGLLVAGGSGCVAHRAVSGLAAGRVDRRGVARSAGGVVGGLPGSWTRQRSPRLRRFRLQAVSCSPDGRHCLAVGVFCVSAVCRGKRAGAVLATADGGSVWVRRPLPRGIRFSGYFEDSPARLSGALSCAGSLRCVVLGWQGCGKRSHMAILLTTTGGKTWAVINGRSLGSGMYGLSCPSASTCFAAGSQGASGAVITTTDGGRQWARLRLPRGTGVLNAIWCPSAARCTAVGADGADHVNASAFAVSTSSGGRAWTRGILPQHVPALIAVSCPPSPTCYATGNSQLRRYILVTTDGGRKWRANLRPEGNKFNELVSISCPCATTCAAAGTAHEIATGAGGPARLIVATSNGGSAWPAQTHPAGFSELLSVSCSRTLRCVAVGNWWTDRGGYFTDSGALILINLHH
jgi:photosystem II stability/assembly factor-like uncharacterized protein